MQFAERRVDIYPYLVRIFNASRATLQLLIFFPIAGEHWFRREHDQSFGPSTIPENWRIISTYSVFVSCERRHLQVVQRLTFVSLGEEPYGVFYRS